METLQKNGETQRREEREEESKVLFTSPCSYFFEQLLKPFFKCLGLDRNDPVSYYPYATPTHTTTSSTADPPTNDSETQMKLTEEYLTTSLLRDRRRKPPSPPLGDGAGGQTG